MTQYTHDEIRAHREQWLAELRSGNRRQVEGYLACRVDDGTDEVGFCCLGVATDMVPGVEYEEVTGSHVFRRYLVADGPWEYLVLPNAARAWLGVTAGDPDLDFTDTQDDWDALGGILDGDVFDQVQSNYEEGSHVTLAMLNDAGATFAQIAEVFETFGFSPRHDVLQGEEVVA